MTRLWILRRTIQFILELFLGLTIAYTMTLFLPINPLRFILQYSYLFQITVTLHGIYFNSPILSSYTSFIKGILTGNWGWSVGYQEPALWYIASILPWTLLLVVPTVLLTLTVGTLIGISVGQIKNKHLQSIPTVILTVLNATPNYIVAIIIWIFLAYRIKLFPPAGNFGSNVGPHEPLNIFFMVSIAYHYTLPILSLWLSTMPSWALYAKSLVVMNLTEDYVTFAKVRGIRGARLKMTYVGKTIYLPLLANLPYTFSYLLSGVVYIEETFSLEGVGSALYASIASRDFDVTAGLFTVFVLIVIIGNYITDISYSFIDPRIKQT